jgi:hypothetical protein
VHASSYAAVVTHRQVDVVVDGLTVESYGCLTVVRPD